jgi:hypothetical protein
MTLVAVIGKLLGWLGSQGRAAGARPPAGLQPVRVPAKTRRPLHRGR